MSLYVDLECGHSEIVGQENKQMNWNEVRTLYNRYLFSLRFPENPSYQYHLDKWDECKRKLIILGGGV